MPEAAARCPRPGARRLPQARRRLPDARRQPCWPTPAGPGQVSLGRNGLRTDGAQAHRGRRGRL